MLNFFNAIVIGFVQGVAEFLPISSSGHLVLIYSLFKIDGDNFALTVFLHMATLFSIIYVYRKDILKLIMHPFCKTNKLLVVATIPTVIIALIFKKVVMGAFGLNYIIFGFIITALVLAISDYLSQKHMILSTTITSQTQSGQLLKYQTPQTVVKKNVIIHSNPALIITGDITNLNIKYFQAIIIGIAQGIACFPGISRSGSTIAAGLICGCDKKEITTFSFLLSIPAILGSMILAIAHVNESSVSINTFSLITACIVSFIVGVISIRLLLKLVKKQKLTYFSYYLLALVFLILLVKFVVK